MPTVVLGPSTREFFKDVDALLQCMPCWSGGGGEGCQCRGGRDVLADILTVPVVV